MRLPIFNRSLCPLDLLVDLQLLVVQLQVPIGDDVVVAETRRRHLLYLLLLLRRRRWAILGSVEVVLRHADVAQDVVVNVRVLLRPEVPGLLLRVVRLVFEPAQLVIEVNDVEGLFVSEGAVLVLRKHLPHVATLYLLDGLLRALIAELLSDWVVTCFLNLHVFVSALDVRIGYALEVCFGLLIFLDISPPGVVRVVIQLCCHLS